MTVYAQPRLREPPIWSLQRIFANNYLVLTGQCFCAYVSPLQTNKWGNTMKRTIGAIALSFVFATAAQATVTTIEYQGAEEKVTVAYDDSTMTSTNATTGNAIAYTYDEATATVCRKDGDKDLCVTFENPGSEAGHTTPFKTNDGREGTATVVSVE
jgi:hypothetical protein